VNAGEKIRIVEETYLPGISVSLVARRHGIGGNQIFTWRRLMAQGALTAATAGEEVVPAPVYRTLKAQISRLYRLLGNKAMENDLLREAVFRAADPKRMARLVRKVISNGQQHQAKIPGDQVGRMAHTIKEVAAKRFHYESYEQLQAYQADFIAAYNFVRRFQIFIFLLPYE
jgi:transposase